MKIVILTFADYFLPGKKAGGPIRSIKNMVEELSDEFDFRIVTRDRDLGDKKPYEGIQRNRWVNVQGVPVQYLSPGFTRLAHVARLLRNESYDLIYLNSFFSRWFSMAIIWLLRTMRLKNKHVIIAPRGEFGFGALSINTGRKLLYIRLSKFLGVYDRVSWQASSEREKLDIEHNYPGGAASRVAPPIKQRNINIAPDLGGKESGRAVTVRKKGRKVKGALKVVFLARISRMKNLDFAVKVLQKVESDIVFTIYGPIEDRKYWLSCKKLLDSLPENVQTIYGGPLTHFEVQNVLEENDLYFLPTLGENYCHGVLEALSCGCVILISDRTQWGRLEELGVGWDLPLDAYDGFVNRIEYCAGLDREAFNKMSDNARKHAMYIENRSGHDIELNREMLRSSAIGEGHYEDRSNPREVEDH